MTGQAPATASRARASGGAAAPDVSRRAVFGTVAGLVALAGVGEVAGAGIAEASTADPVARLLRRATYGPTPAQLAAARKSGVAAWLDAQLAPKSKVPDHAMDQLLTRWPNLGLKSWEVRQKFDNGAWDVMFDLVDAHVARACWSNRQLLEVMVDFWSNHLNVTCPSSEVWDNRHLYDRDVIRAHALGRFDRMLVAMVKHPAMLRYLGNDESDKDNPNENLGRELLELHTVGIDAGYTEEDMRNSTMILTGLSVDEAGGVYEYKPWMHYVGKVKVLGFANANTTAEGGEQVATAYATYLARHPSTAKQIATKLAVHFVDDNPPASLISTLTKTYLDNDTAIAPVLRKLFASKAFNDPARTKLRRPFEDLVATVRALRIKPDSSGTAGIRALQWMSSDVGQPPLAWPLPNGYADAGVAWASTSTTLARWNAHLSLAAHWWPTTLVAPKVRDLLPNPLPATYGGLVDALASVFGVPALSSGQRSAIAGFLDHAPGDALHSNDQAVGWRLPYLAALVLDSPRHAKR